MSGSLSPKVDKPRMRMLAEPPGEPELLETVTPETWPCKAWSIRVMFIFSRSSPFTFEVAPVISLDLAVP